ncbi:hypothetical protein OGAPHI_003803 [Ogataea philodendri]|uniref:Uncharacterized protein n=1 Tax=Ogataea philodendri TaxID=1378263 RepID=A0A9P8T511_9ASCO|nr:uncharacterized protein OGAPHI_003803 [Ogataea philodendri]KAH3665615.1 hypothetical protein OGAPHI_003803 [Ogataea philodendri]
MVFGRHKNKALDLSLMDSNYRPPAVGAVPPPVPPPPVVASPPRPRPVPPIPAQKPTIINNYYYVSPSVSAPHQGQPTPIQRPVSQQKLPGSRNSSLHSQRPVSRPPPRISRESSEESDIYSSPSLAKLELQPRLPQINLDDPSDPPVNPQTPNLIRQLARIEVDSVSVHNRQLYSIFSHFGKDSLNYDDLRQLLSNPEGTHFSSDSARKLCNTFVTTTSDLEFRDFIRLCKFVKGCYDSFKYHDTDRSYFLEPQEFSKSLQFNRISCPDYLLRQIYQNASSLNLEAYILAVVLIRKHEREQHHDLYS